MEIVVVFKLNDRNQSIHFCIYLSIADEDHWIIKIETVDYDRRFLDISLYIPVYPRWRSLDGKDQNQSVITNDLPQTSLSVYLSMMKIIE